MNIFQRVLIRKTKEPKCGATNNMMNGVMTLFIIGKNWHQRNVDYDQHERLCQSIEH